MSGDSKALGTCPVSVLHCTPRQSLQGCGHQTVPGAAANDNKQLLPLKLRHRGKLHGKQQGRSCTSSKVHLQLWDCLSAGQGAGHRLLWNVSPAGSVGGQAPPGLGHLGNTRSRSSSFGNPGHPTGLAQPWLPSPAFPPATGCGKLFWMEWCSSLAPSDGNLSRTRGRHRVTGILHWHLAASPGTSAWHRGSLLS